MPHPSLKKARKMFVDQVAYFYDNEPMLGAWRHNRLVKKDGEDPRWAWAHERLTHNDQWDLAVTGE